MLLNGLVRLYCCGSKSGLQETSVELESKAVSTVEIFL